MSAVKDKEALAKYESQAVGGFRPSTLTEAMTLASKLAESELLPVPLRRKPADVLVILMKGQELGLSPMQSIGAIHVIQGKAVASADLMVGLVKSRPECGYFRMVESTPTSATYETLRQGDPEPTVMAYTMDDARKAKLADKDNWKNHPSAMLRARCSSALARAVYPDLVMGIYTPDEAAEFAHVDIEPPRMVRPPQRKPEPGPELVGEPEPEGPPTWTGLLKEVTSKDGETRGKKWALFTLHGTEGERFQTFDTKVADFALQWANSGNQVTIAYEETAKGGKKVLEIRGA